MTPEGMRRQVGGQSGGLEPPFEHGPDGGLVDLPAGEGSASKRAAPQRRSGRVFADPDRLHVRLDPLIQVLALAELEKPSDGPGVGAAGLGVPDPGGEKLVGRKAGHTTGAATSPRTGLGSTGAGSDPTIIIYGKVSHPGDGITRGGDLREKRESFGRTGERSDEGGIVTRLGRML